MTSQSRNTRVALMQALVATDLSSEDFDPDETKAWLREAGFLAEINRNRFNRWYAEICQQWRELDGAFMPYLKDRSLEELGQAEHMMLRIATYEINHAGVPTAVTINEWVEIAKEFGATNSYRFINGVLDKLATGQSQHSDQHE